MHFHSNMATYGNKNNKETKKLVPPPTVATRLSKALQQQAPARGNGCWEFHSKNGDALHGSKRLDKQHLIYPHLEG